MAEKAVPREASGRTPHDYNPAEFANRQNIIDIVNLKVLQGVRKEQIDHPVITLFGVQGIGKSWVLRHLFWIYTKGKLPYRKTPGQKETLAVYVDLSEFSHVNQARANLIDILQQQLYDRLPETERPRYETSFQQITQTIRSDTPTAPESHTLLVKLVQTLTERYLPLFFLDSMENLFNIPTLTRWFEQEILAPLARTEKVIFVLAGREKIRFPSFAVRERLHPERLVPFDAEETSKQVGQMQNGNHTRLSDIYAYSFGHPYATWKLALQTDTLSDRESVVRTLKEIEQLLLEDAKSQTVCERVRLVSILRSFDVNALRLLLARLENSTLEQKNDTYFLDIIEDMVQSNLVFWSQDESAYLIDPPARKLMNLLRRLNALETYQKHHQAAAEIYQQWIEQYPGIADYIIEALYHKVARRLEQESSQVPDSVWTELEPWLKQIFESENWKSSHANDLYNDLKDDQEIKNLLPAAVWQQLVDLVYSFTDYEDKLT